ncbi:hypothetical protein [Amycolatopsis sp. NPDC049159]|uniref:hypothetical protein n=1 Tax=Amycolatopsis sp. NPDC049159 TaxID=3157210 RepID=UPI00340A84C7
MTVIRRVHRTVAVHPGLFFLVNAVTVDIEFPAEPIGTPGSADEPLLRKHRDAFTGSGPQFGNPEYVRPGTQFTVPVSGRRDVVVTRRLLVSPARFTPPLDDPNPAGLEHWSITVLPEHDSGRCRGPWAGTIPAL